jgi:hypothetical protein
MMTLVAMLKHIFSDAAYAEHESKPFKGGAWAQPIDDV